MSFHGSQFIFGKGSPYFIQKAIFFMNHHRTFKKPFQILLPLCFEFFKDFFDYVSLTISK